MAKKYDEGDKFRRWKIKLDKPAGALKAVGVMVESDSQRAFKLQRHGQKNWPPRGKINVFGLIADFTKGKRAPFQRRFQQRPALKDTGTLSKSVKSKPAGPTAIIIGSNLDYASVHHFGGTVESKPITSNVQRLLWKWLKGTGSKHKEKLGWLLNKKFTGETLETQVPERPIVGLTKTTRKDIKKLFGVHVMEIT